MIPKIIHLCWLSGDPFPADIQKCLDSWKEQLPDYEVWVWDTKRFDIDSTVWTRQAFDAKRYAFAADYIRLYALYNYGGIYLDSDVLAYKNFDDLLSLPYFIGEDYDGAFEAAVIGAEKGCQFIKDVLDYYDGRQFVLPDGTLDTLQLPLIFRKQLIRKGYHFHKRNGYGDLSLDEKVLTIFPKDYFNSRDAIGAHRYRNSYCSHNFAGSWERKAKSKKDEIKSNLPRWILKTVLKVTNLLHYKRLQGYRIPYDR